MPTYRIREYYLYYDEYEVDAPDIDTAEQLSDRYIQSHPVTGVIQTEEHAYEDHHDTMRFEVYADGSEDIIERF